MKELEFFDNNAVRRLSWLVLLFLALIIICVAGGSIYFILANANWVLGDDSFFLVHTVAGKPMPVLIGSGAGRFVPLAYLEFNIFIDAGNNPYPYYILQALKFVLAILAFALVLRLILFKYIHLPKTRTVYAWLGLCLSMVVFITAPWIFNMFSDVIHLESTLIPCLLLFLYFYLQAIKSDKTIHFLLALMFGNLAIYIKEPVFGALIVLVGVPYLFARSELSRKRTIFSLCVVVSGFVYLLLYYFLVYKGVDNGFYNSGRILDRGPVGLVLLAIRNHPIIVLLSGIALVRAFFMFRRRDTEIYIFDGFLFAGLAYYFAFILLNMDARRYMSTLYVFAIPPVFYYFLSALNRRSLLGGVIPACILLLSLGLLFPAHLYSWERQIDYSQSRRLNDTPKLLELARAANGNTIYLLGKHETAGYIKFRVKVLNRFLETYGYEGSANHLFDLNILRDSPKEFIVLVSPEIADDPDLANLLEAGNFQYLLTFWYRMDAYSNIPSQTPP